MVHNGSRVLASAQEKEGEGGRGSLLWTASICCLITQQKMINKHPVEFNDRRALSGIKLNTFAVETDHRFEQRRDGGGVDGRRDLLDDELHGLHGILLKR